MRKPMVTRTFETMNITAMVVELATAEVKNITIELPRVIKDEKKLEKVVSTDMPNGIKFVAIVDTAVKQNIYGMSEADFLKHARVLDENRKIVDEDEHEIEPPVEATEEVTEEAPKKRK